MGLVNRITEAITKAKTLLTKVVATDGNSVGKNIKYSEDDVLNAGITRDYKSKKEERDITAIREERKMRYRIEQRMQNHKKSLPK